MNIHLLKQGFPLVLLAAASVSCAKPASAVGLVEQPVGTMVTPQLATGVPVIRNDLDLAYCSTHPNPGPQAGTPNPSGMPAWTPAKGRPLNRVELVNDDARCNDGSRAIMYVRPAPLNWNNAANENINKWHIHFNGGGSCSSYKECWDRWCDSGKQLNNPHLMSSLNTRKLAGGAGVFKDDPNNDFASYNQVDVYYCSSDLWIGNTEGSDSISTQPLDLPITGSANIYFKGKVIVDAVIDQLSSTSGFAPGGMRYYDHLRKKYVSMPRMVIAETVLLSGDSAGANGLRHHLDRIVDKLKAQHVDENQLTVVAAFDAGGAPKMDNILFDWSALPAMDYADNNRLTYESMQSFHGVTPDALDESCVNAYSPAEDICTDHRFVQQSHITTQAFQRTSLRDILTVRALVDNGMVPTEADVAQYTYDGLVEQVVADNESRSDTVMMGPNCGTHVTFRNNKHFYRQRVAVGSMTVSERLEDYVGSCESGLCNPIVQIADPTPAGAPSVCP